MGLSRICLYLFPQLRLKPYAVYFTLTLLAFAIFSMPIARAQVNLADQPSRVRSAEKYNWAQAPKAPSSLSAGSQAAISLTPCPLGVDGKNIP